jgi:hypothetical protein
VALPASPLSAQGWREIEAWSVAVASRPAFVGGGLAVRARDRGRTRLGVGGAAGALEGGDAAGRIEATWHFLLDPARASGLALYGGGGIALASGAGGRLAARLQLALGAETAPASRRSLFVELGVGGGVRAAAGLRWRKRNAPSR